MGVICNASVTITLILKDEHGSQPGSNGREGSRNFDNHRKPGDPPKKFIISNIEKIMKLSASAGSS